MPDQDPSVTLEVRAKTQNQAASRHFLDNLRHLGLGGVKTVQPAQLYRLFGHLSPSERERIARDLLCDPIMEQWQLADGPTPTDVKSHPLTVDVWFKPGVTDVVGDSVRKGIDDLGIKSVCAVRTGSRFRFWGLVSQEAAERMARTYLANPLVQEFSIHAD